MPPKTTVTLAEDADEHQLEQCVTFIDRDGELIEAMCCDYGFRSGAMRMYSDEDGRIPTNFVALGVQNFNTEYRALRRSFRDNDYAVYSESLHLSENPLTRLVGWIGGGIVRSIGAVDRKLEKQGLLSKLQSNPLPPNVTDTQGGHKGPLYNNQRPTPCCSTGQLITECSEIRRKLQELTLDNDAVWARERARPQVEAVWPIKVVYHVLCWFLDVVFDGRPIARAWMLETVARMPYFSYVSSTPMCHNNTPLLFLLIG